MKNLLLAAALVFASVGVQAEQLSCDEVDEVGEALTGLGEALDSGVEIGDGSEETQALHDVVTGLADIAEAEEDEDLANASLGMANAWEANDRDAFTDALADAVVKLAIVHNNDCN